MTGVGHYDASDYLDPALQALLLQGLLSAHPSYIACIDRERRLLYLNRSESRELGDLLGKPIDLLIDGAHRDGVIADIERAFESGQRQVITYQVIAPDGNPRHFTADVVPLRETSGRSVALLVSSDDTERWQLRTDLLRSEEFRRRVIEHLPDYVSLLDRNHRFIWVNRVAPGLQVADVLGTRIEKYILPESVGPTSRAIDEAFVTGKAGQVETEGYRDAGSTRWVLNRTVPLEVDGRVDAVLLITSDLSELKRAEQALREKDKQLHHAQHLESIGQLAGGIAHDFNNLLQVIDGNLYFIREGLAAGDDIHEELEQAFRATRSAAELTSRLLAVGRRKRLTTTRVDLGALISDNMRMLRAAIPENIDILYEPAPEPYFVGVDAPEFEQVLINLCVNARDAMPTGGTLRVWVEARGADQVALVVADDGVGIPPKDLSRVFEPFFSTKARGSGLGLAVVAGIIAAHGGTITAASDGLSGTTMTVCLPRTAAAEASPAGPGADASRRGSATVLVAEDEPHVRAQVVRVLAGAGYAVVEAENGLRAIELFRANPDAIDALVLDAIMPLCDGWRAYLEIERLRPGVKVLFTTGYAATVLPADFSERGAQLLSKPFEPEQLLAKLAELLRSPAAGS